MEITAQQITFGPKHHFFGYIGHCRTIPWNGTGRYMLCLETDFQDRMPRGDDVARVMLIDTHHGYAMEKTDESRGWNPQQGSMLYWNPGAPDTQFFFNDRDRETGMIFTVLYDIEQRKRVREYRFDDTPVANGGVAQNGGSFLAINYGRMARLRPVTGYPDAFDWTEGVGVPDDDGIFRIDIETGEKVLVCSFRQTIDTLREQGALQPEDDPQVFFNHTLWNREDDRILFLARSGWDAPGVRLNGTFTMRPDGSGLTYHGTVAGHPEWMPDSRILAEGDEGLRVYDVPTKQYVGVIGDKEIFFSPKGDKALSPEGDWLVHGNRQVSGNEQYHEYVLYHMADGVFLRSPRFRRGKYVSGDTRLDSAPCWNRDANQVLVPAIADDGTRNLFVIQVHKG